MDFRKIKKSPFLTEDSDCSTKFEENFFKPFSNKSKTPKNKINLKPNKNKQIKAISIYDERVKIQFFKT